MEQGMQRFRRLRKNETIRSMMRETRLHPADLIYPIFVIEGENIKNPVDSMPGVYQYSIDRLNEIMDKVKESGISGVLLFGIPACKDEMGHRLMQRMVLPSVLFPISRKIILKSIVSLMYVCVNIPPMAIAAWSGMGR